MLDIRNQNEMNRWFMMYLGGKVVSTSLLFELSEVYEYINIFYFPYLPPIIKLKR